MKTLHTFGCPVFALHHAITGDKSIPRWDPRLRIGLYLGPSPLHACNMHLVLSLTTGLVSPQFHCCFDNFFETCKYGVSGMGISSTWQRLVGLKCAANGDSWIQPDQRLLNRAPIRKLGNFSESQLPRLKSCHLNHKMSKVFLWSSLMMKTLMILNPGPTWSNHLKNQKSIQGEIHSLKTLRLIKRPLLEQVQARKAAPGG
jgi:hypothetical protein